MKKPLLGGVLILFTVGLGLRILQGFSENNGRLVLSSSKLLLEPVPGNPQSTYLIWRTAELAQIVIAHFDRYPLRAKKAKGIQLNLVEQLKLKELSEVAAHLRKTRAAVAVRQPSDRRRDFAAGAFSFG